MDLSLSKVEEKKLKSIQITIWEKMKCIQKKPEVQS